MTWEPFKQGNFVMDMGNLRQLADSWAAQHGMSSEEAFQKATGTILREITDGSEIHFNNLYVVLLRRFYSEKVECEMVYLSIRRQDRKPVRSWTHLQRIKEELVGKQYQAVEIFPPSSHTIDSCNQYHLWVFAEPCKGVPFDLSMPEIGGDTSPIT